MYAVIKTGGKQYRVRPGDVLVVEKLAGEAGAEVAFDQVLMVGEGAEVTVGAPVIEGAVVKATLVETRKGEKVKIFKKIRRHGYRRTRGHRQLESVLRVTSVAGGGKSEAWDGTVDLTPRAVLTARARGLKSLADSLAAESTLLPVVEEAAPAPKAARAKKAAEPAAEAPATEAPAETAPAPEAEAAPVKTPRAKTAEAAAPAADAEAAAKPARAKKAAAEAETEEAAPAKKPAARKKPAADGGEA